MIVSAKQIIVIVLLIVGAAGIYIVSIGGIAKSPQRVTMSSGSFRTVANGRAQLHYAQWSSVPEVEVLCHGERYLVDINSSQPSETVCGIRVRMISASAGFTGAPQAELEVTW